MARKPKVKRGRKAMYLIASDDAKPIPLAKVEKAINDGQYDVGEIVHVYKRVASYRVKQAKTTIEKVK